MVDIIRVHRAAVYHNPNRLTAAQIQAQTGCSHILNGWVFNTQFQPCNWMIANGRIISCDTYRDWGFGCQDAGTPYMTTDRTLPHYLSGVPILKDGIPLDRELTADVARSAARSAVGWLGDGSILLWCDPEPLTRESLQRRLLSAGCLDALMLDGGGSVQGIFPDGKVTSSRCVPSFLLFWEEENSASPPATPASEAKTVCLDAGHDAGNTTNASPDGTLLEHELALDLALRMKALLERSGVRVVLTRSNGAAMSLAERCRLSNEAKVSLFVSLHSNASGSSWSTPRGWSAYVYGQSGSRMKAAQSILKRVQEANILVRSTPIVANPGLYVLKHTTAPAVLLEQGFHTNREDAAFLKDGAYRQRLAQAQVDGILDYLGIPVSHTPSPDAESADALHWLGEAGLLQDGLDSFTPNQPVTQQQFAVWLHRYHQKYRPATP